MQSLFKKAKKKTLNKKGVAGLNVLLSVVTMIFVIGLLIMIYAFMGAELKEQISDNTSSQIINDTIEEIASVTGWFGIIIVITAMVVLILLTVMIIQAIRGTGMVT